MNNQGRLLRMSEAAKVLGVSLSFAYQLAQRNAIPTLRLGHSVRVPADALADWINANTRQGEESAFIGAK